MRYGPKTAIAVMIVLWVAASSWAESFMRPPRTVEYQGERMWVRIVKGTMTKVIFPDPVPIQPFPVDVNQFKLSRDKMDARQVIIHSLNPTETLEITVNTTRQPYSIVLELGNETPDSVVTVVHTPDALRVAPAAEPEFPPIRSLWVTQWRGDPERPEPGVLMRPISGVLADNAEQTLKYRFYVEGHGHYGWTVSLFNKTSSPKSLQIEQIRDPEGQLVSVIAQHETSPYHETRSVDVIHPQETVLLHLLYREGGR